MRQRGSHIGEHLGEKRDGTCIDVQIVANLRGINRFFLILQGRAMRDDIQFWEARELSNQLFGEPVGKVVLLRIARNIVERQHCDGWPGRQRKDRIFWL